MSQLFRILPEQITVDPRDDYVKHLPDSSWVARDTLLNRYNPQDFPSWRNSIPINFYDKIKLPPFSRCISALVYSFICFQEEADFFSRMAYIPFVSKYSLFFYVNNRTLVETRWVSPNFVDEAYIYVFWNICNIEFFPNFIRSTICTDEGVFSEITHPQYLPPLKPALYYRGG